MPYAYKSAAKTVLLPSPSPGTIPHTMEFLLHSSRQIVQGIRHNNKTKIVIVATLLFLLTSSFLLAWPCRSPDTFIGHADEANLANLAQNIANGKGAVVDTAWLYTNGGIPGEKLPQPEPYWSVSMRLRWWHHFSAFSARHA